MPMFGYLELSFSIKTHIVFMGIKFDKIMHTANAIGLLC